MLNDKLHLSLNKILFFLVLVFILGLFLYEYSPLFLSISTILIGITGLIHIRYCERNYLTFIIFILTLLISGLSLAYSDDLNYGLERLKIKLPMLALALPWISMRLSKDQYHIILKWFLFLTATTSFLILLNYIFNQDHINDLYKIGQVMPTPINHIRFSLMVALSLYISIDLWRTSLTTNKVWFLILAISLTCFLHVYSVRTGLLSAYAVILMQFVKELQTKKRKATILVLPLSIVTILITSYFLSPTFRAKINDSKADLMVYKNKTYSNYYSITTRIISYEAAVEIWKKNKIMGCGIGDIKTETDKYFKLNRPEIETPILPHNQFLLILASLGIAGLITFLISFYGALFTNQLLKNHFLIAHYIIVSISFLFEPMLETQLGVAFVMIFITIGILNNNYNNSLLVSKEEKIL